MAELRYEHDDCATLYVVGGNSEHPDEKMTPEIGRLMSIARDTGVADWVRFVGRRDRDVLRLFYSACDVFVTTPWYEPFGITPVEAMACARPVIGADVGGIRSTVVHNKTGLLVPPKNPGALAQCLHELINDEKRCQTLGDAGFARAQRFYTWTGVVRGLEAVYVDAVRAAAAKTRVTAQRQPVRQRPAAPVMRPPHSAPARAIQRTGHDR
jgi:D-inositol-3-phosphate glycosyltransferase